MSRRGPLFLALLAAALVSMGFDWAGRIGRLREELQHVDSERRAQAVRELAAHPAGEVGELVLTALSDPELGVRIDAAAVAGELELAAAAPILLGWLEDEDEDVRAAAARALGTLDEPSISAALLRALADPRASVRVAAVQGLARRDRDPDEVLRGLTMALDDADGSVRSAAAMAIAERGGAAEGGLTGLLARSSDDAPEVRVAVARALGALGRARATSTLRRLLSDPSPDVRRAAATSLGRLRAMDAVVELANATRDAELSVAEAALAALGRVPGTPAFEALAATASGTAARSPHVAIAAVTERMRLDPVAARAELLLGLEGRLAGQEAPERVARWITQLMAVGVAPGLTDAAPFLVEIAQADVLPPSVAFAALGQSGGEVALAELLAALERAQHEGSAYDDALTGLSMYFDVAGADGRAIEPLLDALLRATSPIHRATIATLVGRTLSPRAIAALVSAIEAERDDRAAAAELAALAAIARATADDDAAWAGAIRVAEARVRDGAGDVRTAAGELLGETGDRAALVRAVATIEGEPGIDRVVLVRAAARIAARASPTGDEASGLIRTLRERMTSDDGPLAAAALDAAAVWGAPEALALLLEVADTDPDAAFALGRFSASEATERLRAIVTDATREPGTPTRARVEHAARAASALGEHGAAEDATVLIEATLGLPWPASAAASFSLARLARRGVLTDALGPELCAVGRLLDPVVRANVAIALTSLGVTACSDVVRGWLLRPNAAVVRAAAVRWALRDGGSTRAVSVCDDLPPSLVERACASPALPPLDGRADVVAYELDGRTLAAHRWLALFLGDGSVLLTRTDARARIVLERAPSGPMVLEDPANLPLTP